MNFCEAVSRLDRIVGIIQFVVKIGWDIDVHVGDRLINYSRLKRGQLRPLLLCPVFMKQPLWNINRMTVLPIDGSLVEDSADCNADNCIERLLCICYGCDSGCHSGMIHFLVSLFSHIMVTLLSFDH